MVPARYTASAPGLRHNLHTCRQRGHAGTRGAAPEHRGHVPGAAPGGQHVVGGAGAGPGRGLAGGRVALLRGAQRRLLPGHRDAGRALQPLVAAVTAQPPEPRGARVQGHGSAGVTCLRARRHVCCAGHACHGSRGRCPGGRAVLASRGPGAAGGLVAHAAAAAVLRQLLLTSPLSSPPPQLTRSVRHVSYVLLCLETGKLVFVHKTIDKKNCRRRGSL